MADKTYPFRSGFCGTGLCEGTKPKSPSGFSMKTCPRVFPNTTFAYDAKGKVAGRADAVCMCKCHADLDKLFEMSGMERVLQDNPEYHVPKADYWMPSLEDRVASFMASAPTPVRYIESPAPDLVPATIERTYTPTATGRSARGELESYVKKACDDWLVDAEGNVCSPAYIARQAARMMGIAKDPSQGAINAVLERWVSLGFAVVEKKPTRFVRYTEDGVRLGLDAMKIRAKS